MFSKDVVDAEFGAELSNTLALSRIVYLRQTVNTKRGPEPSWEDTDHPEFPNNPQFPRESSGFVSEKFFPT